ncbi:integration host factor subunit alpha [Candidatus Thioglobus autotrophicus]|jgi:integration host factor subunit alpha|uniref:Integration host factor subunit alpha n=1 Tax=Candidatus Thioglobus autotrophicus TaxID=1705394 RepID=A0A0M4NXF7_9GAMM|nr:integration host factor subunit alpha [Candidatus Thioglobus autotrophicus]ALE52993.1 integration host factor subunit alpha [Candidatus Thioglobus autotrophicus]WPE17064.1 integration host factor subunit alpha [Candidatus Thioglobus autotrophicus]WPE18619.1 integration host factor subunit alpha [Candidatus Thioglobus autotrophicus]
MALSKKDIADELVREIEITHAQALQLTNDFFNQIQATLASGEEVKLSSFGNFVLREKSARPGRNPKTGEAVEISARKVVSFKAGPKLKKLTQAG